MKKQVECEGLLRWAYRDELPKKMTSSAEGIWDRIKDQRPGQDPGHGAAQRYPHFGLPHPDAERVEMAVGRLQDLCIDWDMEGWAILGDLLALADPRSPALCGGAYRPPSKAGWPVIRPGGRTGRQSAKVDPPRDVILVRTLRTAALVTMHAGMGTRPGWQEEPPRPTPIYRGSKPTIVGECRGKNLYTAGSYCPMEWTPSPITIAETRADYLAWWRGLMYLAETLVLEDYNVLPPLAPEMPWRDGVEYRPPVRATLWPPKLDKLPLNPERKITGPPKRIKSSAGRKVARTA